MIYACQGSAASLNIDSQKQDFSQEVLTYDSRQIVVPLRSNA